MKKFVLMILASLCLFSTTPSVFADDAKKQSEISNQFQLVDQAKLSDVEKAFVKIAREHKGVHKFGTLYVIAAGPKANLGYGLKYEKQEQLLERLIIYVKETTPEPGKAYADVISYPCIIGRVNLPPYTTLSVYDVDIKKAFGDHQNFLLDFKEKQITNDRRKVWSINLETPITQSELDTYKVSIKQLGKNEKEVPVTILLDKKNRKTIKVIPRIKFEPGSFYLLEIVYVTKKDTKMTVIPFEVKGKKGKWK
ncbi:protease complex subunit PrcB family protein [Bacillus sp. RG28]|uniref:Protease complex subunit PrcB family protein n=1 Tax=Gottfriedia endophytica TaxID=2820819 RepID=A0A940NQ26_9BACI|nr:protease complex subunit PrcB family protein [Gottfriedia endophytica]MBP0725670.1 protease complex subunit PrcB family protein [Gottfriedia endophytica]